MVQDLVYIYMIYVMEFLFTILVTWLTAQICLRLVTDPAEIMDCPEMAEALAHVSAEEMRVAGQQQCGKMRRRKKKHIFVAVCFFQ